MHSLHDDTGEDERSLLQYETEGGALAAGPHFTNHSHSPTQVGAKAHARPNCDHSQKQQNVLTLSQAVFIAILVASVVAWAVTPTLANPGIEHIPEPPNASHQVYSMPTEIFLTFILGFVTWAAWRTAPGLFQVIGDVARWAGQGACLNSRFGRACGTLLQKFQKLMNHGTWPHPGEYLGAIDGTAALLTVRPIGPWGLRIGSEEYLLEPDENNSQKSSALGTVKCDDHRGEVGTFTIGRGNLSANGLLLKVVVAGVECSVTLSRVRLSF